VNWSLAIHGGAGVIERGDLSAAKEAAYRQGLADALAAGRALLADRRSAVDAVEAAVKVLEDNPLFNAGRGAAIAADDRVYLDAAIMDGSTLRAGAVAGITRTRNPVMLARAVMERTRHVMLAGEGADQFSIEQGLAQVDPQYFRTPEREQALRDWRNKHAAALDRIHLHGTVGAVALDADGHLAAATSTGGLTGKQWGRIGDSAIIGAGTYAADGCCAVSTTGTGEYFIRASAARQLCDRVRWLGEDVERAARETIRSVSAIGGDGGLIAVDASGRPAFAITAVGMYRGAVSSGQPEVRIGIYADERIS
jgi:beta-aspartyl-peptidase (threonine type)